MPNLTQRPREKVRHRGYDSLSDSELLALVLRTGSAQHDVLSLARQICKRYPIYDIVQMDWRQLSRINGIGPVKAMALQAAITLSQRAQQLNQPARLDHPQQVAQIVHDIAAKKQEYLICLYLNGRHQLIKRQTICIGTLTANLIHPREVFAPAITHRAASVILVHNHPSGDSQPSAEDIIATERMVAAGELLDIPIIDHVIVTYTAWLSFRSQQLL